MAVRIGSEDDLWAALERYLTPDTPAGRETFEIRGWSPQLLYFPDEPTHHSIRPSAARAVTEFHKSLSRSYAYLVYGNANATLLKSDDRLLLDLEFLVIGGSTGVDATDRALEAIARAIVQKMSDKQITLSVIIFLLLFFSSSIGASWLSEHYETRRAEDASSERIALSEQETRRVEMMAQALGSAPELAPVKEESESSKTALVRPITQRDSGAVLGTPISQEQAKVIVSKEKQRGEGRRIDGEYRVNDINTTTPLGYVAEIENIDTGEKITVEVNRDDLPAEDIHLIFQVAEDKSSLIARVNAWVVGGKIVRANIVRADPVEE